MRNKKTYREHGEGSFVGSTPLLLAGQAEHSTQPHNMSTRTEHTGNFYYMYHMRDKMMFYLIQAILHNFS